MMERYMNGYELFDCMITGSGDAMFYTRKDRTGRRSFYEKCTDFAALFGVVSVMGLALYVTCVREQTVNRLKERAALHRYIDQDRDGKVSVPEANQFCERTGHDPAVLDIEGNSLVYQLSGEDVLRYLDMYKKE